MFFLWIKQVNQKIIKNTLKVYLLNISRINAQILVSILQAIDLKLDQ